MCGLVALSAGLFYLTSASSLSDDGKWILIGITFASASSWVLIGGRPVAVQNQTLVAQDNTEDLVSSDDMDEEESSNTDIPQPVKQEESLDGVSLKQRKLAKIKAAEAEAEGPQQDIEELDEVQVSVENVHQADEYVVEVSPESVEDADIELTVSNRRVQHQVIRERIEKRRRNQLAEIRASTVKMWEQHNEGEDIVGMLQNPDHGQNILEEPLKPQAGHVYGATFIRLDETSILKLRTPLDSGFEEVEKKEKLPELPGIPGMPLPPLPDGSMPLPPLPNPNASDALAALKMQMDED
ncbi:MAG TPA: hypothetical protein D7H99_03145 [Candidatus Poseidoniales archaeon]|nr:MAG TPA: hypothetical protein D7H99_03145 [Candidatus Poseidoniales archaeon]|tara:strand:+ start:5580 stop:6470 length:891 start_codon:yes stop_codon:yes gene_type:complete